ncbi:MAG: anion permease [Acidobacteriia bacterium]|nr:anion permease [Terriglobia bacterium]
MSTTVAPSTPVSTPAIPAIKWIWFAVAIFVGFAVGLMPTPQGLTHNGQLVLAILAFAIVLWATEVMNNGVASILMMALLIAIAKVPPPKALSGFSDPAFWTLVAVLYYGFAMRKTGLAERISYWILSLFPGSYSGILTAFFVIGLVLAMGIPSMTVRTSIMAPIAWALVQTLGLKPRSRAAALIMITVVEMAVVPGLAFLLGSLNGPVVIKMFGEKHIPLTQGSYFEVMALPTLILCGLILFFNQWLLKPEAPLNASREFARSKLAALGSLKRQELITAVVVVVSIFLWATQSTPNQTRLHPFPSYVIGMVALTVFALAGILQDSDIATGVSWTLLLFLGGIFGLQTVIPDAKITDWMASMMVPHMQALVSSPILLLVLLALIMLALRWLDPTAFIALPLVFLPLAEPLAKSGIPPMILTAPLLLCSAPFWLPYMNFWIAMGDGITARQAWNLGQLFWLASLYAVAAIIATIIGFFYWRLIGVL